MFIIQFNEVVFENKPILFANENFNEKMSKIPQKCIAFERHIIFSSYVSFVIYWTCKHTSVVNVTQYSIIQNYGWHQLYSHQFECCSLVVLAYFSIFSLQLWLSQKFTLVHRYFVWNIICFILLKFENEKLVKFFH